MSMQTPCKGRVGVKNIEFFFSVLLSTVEHAAVLYMRTPRANLNSVTEWRKFAYCDVIENR